MPTTTSRYIFYRSCYIPHVYTNSSFIPYCSKHGVLSINRNILLNKILPYFSAVVYHKVSWLRNSTRAAGSRFFINFFKFIFCPDFVSLFALFFFLHFFAHVQLASSESCKIDKRWTPRLRFYGKYVSSGGF